MNCNTQKAKIASITEKSIILTFNFANKVKKLDLDWSLR